MTTKLFRLLASVLVASMVLSACLAPQPGPPTPPPPKNDFQPLAPPVFSSHSLTLLQKGSVDKQSAAFDLLSSFVSVKYGQTGFAVGGVEHEEVTLLKTNQHGTSRTIKWGDWFDGEVSYAEYYGRDGQLLGGLIELMVKKASLLQLFTPQGMYPIDRSKISLIYVNNGKKIVLDKIVYSERYGATAQDILAMGVTATWSSRMAQIVPSEYLEWGFWENGESPFEMATAALEAIKLALNTKYGTPDLLVIDRDSIRELIGRQTGFEVEKDGKPWGKITLTYSNTFGRAPNTTLIGSGALSRVEYELAGGEIYYSILLLTPQISPQPSTLYLFVDDKATGDAIAGDKQTRWTSYYQKLRSGSMPHVIYAVHAIGDLRGVSSSSTVQVSGSSDGKSVNASGNVTIDLGSVGGIAYSQIGNWTWEQIMLAREVLNLLGESGMKALGFYFPSEPGSGSGLDYFISVSSLVFADPKTALDVWNQDAGYIDRKGIVDVQRINRGLPKNK